MPKWRYSFTTLHFGTRWREVVSVTHQPLYLCGPRAGLNNAEKREIFYLAGN
jgi:hypothetical protein